MNMALPVCKRGAMSDVYGHMEALRLGFLTCTETSKKFGQLRAIRGDFRLQRHVKMCFVELLTGIEIMYNSLQFRAL